MTNVIFSFDTEDIVNDIGADGILMSAHILREEGFKGCFNIIGLLPEKLVEWNRFDIINELKDHHDINYHSHTHSIHPTINEYTDKENFFEALDEFVKDESEGLKKVQSLFGTKGLKAACIPGNCTSYVAHYGYENMGFSFFSGDDIYDKASYRPINVCNIISLHYARSLDGILFEADEEKLKRFIADTAKNKDTVIFYHHPQRAFCKSFWDADNLYRVNTPKESWKKSEIHNPADTERFYKNFRTLIKLLKSDPDFNITTYAELDEKLDRAERVITVDDIPSIKAQLDEELFPVTLPDSYCISDIFLACKDFLLNKGTHTCKKVYGFLSEPYSASETITVSRKEITDIMSKIDESSFLPPCFYIEEKKLGPCDVLYASLHFLTSDDEQYTISPLRHWQIDLNEFPSLRDLNYKGSWLHADTLEDNYLSDRLRLQSWTIRLPKGSKRKIF